MPVSLRRIAPIDPRDLMQGTYGEWLQLILLSGLLIAIAGAVLPKRLTEKRYGKAIPVLFGIMAGVGIYLAKGTMYFNLESFGLIGIAMTVIIAAMAMYGLVKSGLSKPTAVALTYCIIFLSFVIIEPSIFDAFARSLPIMNLIFYGAFIYLAIRLLFGMLKSDIKLDDSFRTAATINPLAEQEQKQVKREIEAEKEEAKDLHKKTYKTTKLELNNIDDMTNTIGKMTGTVQGKGNNLTDQDKAQFMHNLRQLSRQEKILLEGLRFIQDHAKAYKAIHKKETAEIEERMKQAKGKQLKILQDELSYQKKMQQALFYLDKYESKILDFKKTFDRHAATAIERIKEHKSGEALELMKQARFNLEGIKHILDKQKHLVTFLEKCEKKTIRDLKKEKKTLNP